MSAQDELAATIYGITTENTFFDHNELADAILAAGYRKPRTITTIDELDALPAGSVILSNHGEDSAQKDDVGYWYLWGGDVGLVSEEIALPATVIHEPAA